eukprot:TRINITY_DN15103_c0_g1_i1.p1 TRINITY_DN15103_c0_g1~~TRINITY_DN15103_c0_g1_i1.p1  ORF type:complete len:229 (-),score=25.96 TRINITY_DN15103_c0_g1_i1:345-980(-)
MDQSTPSTDAPVRVIVASSAPVSGTSFRECYSDHGVGGYYEQFGSQYTNPHEREIRQALRMAVKTWGAEHIRLKNVLDLACGSGEATCALRDLGAVNVESCDPYTYEAFEKRTGNPCERWGFDEVEGGCLEGKHYSLIVCSYAMHLVTASRLVPLGIQLAMAGRYLLIVSPHKNPYITTTMGWETIGEIVHERVHVRLYRSLYIGYDPEEE